MSPRSAAVLVVGAALALAGEPASGDPAGEQGSPAAQEAPTGRPAARSPLERRERRRDRQDAWWQHAREVLFSDLELSAEQAREVDALLEAQSDVRERLMEIDAEIAAAHTEGDRARGNALRGERDATLARLEPPDDLMEEMRAHLSEEQRPTFDMNRARLAAEGQARHGDRQPRRGRPAAAVREATRD